MIHHLDDNEFSVASYELAYGTVNFNSDRLFSLKFNPLIPGNRNRALSSDLDPDSNFNFDMFRCDYFTENQFNELFDKTRSSFSNRFSLLHLNIRSLPCNRGGLMVSALDSGSSGPGSGPGQGHCIVFLGKTLYSHGASLHPGV